MTKISKIKGTPSKVSKSNSERNFESEKVLQPYVRFLHQSNNLSRRNIPGHRFTESLREILKNAALRRCIADPRVLRASVEFPLKTTVAQFYSGTVGSTSRLKLIDELHSGYKSHIALEKLIKVSKLPLTTLAEDVLEINPKTLSAYRKTKRHLPTRLNEHVIKLIELYSKGIELFENSEHLNLWMNSKAFGLGNRVPLKLINSITGINLVYEELDRIEFGATA